MEIRYCSCETSLTLLAYLNINHFLNLISTTMFVVVSEVCVILFLLIFLIKALLL